MEPELELELEPDREAELEPEPEPKAMPGLAVTSSNADNLARRFPHHSREQIDTVLERASGHAWAGRPRSCGIWTVTVPQLSWEVFRYPSQQHWVRLIVGR